MRAIVAVVSWTILLAGCTTPEGKARVQRIADTLHSAGESLQSSGPNQAQTRPTATRLGGSRVGLCTPKGESAGQGYKTCRYECGGGPAVLNVGIAELCPVNPR